MSTVTSQRTLLPSKTPSFSVKTGRPGTFCFTAVKADGILSRSCKHGRNPLHSSKIKLDGSTDFFGVYMTFTPKQTNPRVRADPVYVCFQSKSLLETRRVHCDLRHKIEASVAGVKATPLCRLRLFDEAGLTAYNNNELPGGAVTVNFSHSVIPDFFCTHKLMEPLTGRDWVSSHDDPFLFTFRTDAPSTEADRYFTAKV